MYLLRQLHIIDMNTDRDLHSRAVYRQSCIAGVGTGGSILHIQIDPNTLVVTGSDGVLSCPDGCILRNQGIGINAVPTGLAGLRMVHLVLAGIVGRIGRTGYGHIMLRIDLKRPGRDNIAIFILQAVHCQLEGVNSKVGSQNHLCRLHFAPCAFKGQRIKTIGRCAGQLYCLRVVGIRNTKPLHCGDRFCGLCLVSQGRYGEHSQDQHQRQSQGQLFFQIFTHTFSSFIR